MCTRPWLWWSLCSSQIKTDNKHIVKNQFLGVAIIAKNMKQDDINVKVLSQEVFQILDWVVRKRHSKRMAFDLVCKQWKEASHKRIWERIQYAEKHKYKADTRCAQSQWGRNRYWVLRTPCSVAQKNLEVLEAQCKTSSERWAESGQAPWILKLQQTEPGGLLVGGWSLLIYVFKSSLGSYKLINQDCYQ